MDMGVLKLGSACPLDDSNFPSTGFNFVLTFEQLKELLLFQLKIEKKKAQVERPVHVEARSDDLSELRLVPNRDEKNPETFFVFFACLAETRGNAVVNIAMGFDWEGAT